MDAYKQVDEKSLSLQAKRMIMMIIMSNQVFPRPPQPPKPKLIAMPPLGEFRWDYQCIVCRESVCCDSQTGRRQGILRQKSYEIWTFGPRGLAKNCRIFQTKHKASHFTQNMHWNREGYVYDLTSETSDPQPVGYSTGHRGNETLCESESNA